MSARTADAPPGTAPDHGPGSEAGPAAAEPGWRALHRDLGGFIRRRVADPALAEDLLQETFVRIQRGLPRLADRERLGAWAHRIARNVIVDHMRRRREEHPMGALVAEVPESSARHPEHPSDPSDASRVLGGWLLATIRLLPETYREAVRLAEVEGVSQQQVAQHLGLSPSGARSRVQRGRALLRARLQRCCDVELDRRGNVVDYRCRSCGCEQAG